MNTCNVLTISQHFLGNYLLTLHTSIYSVIVTKIKILTHPHSVALYEEKQGIKLLILVKNFRFQCRYSYLH